MSNHREEGGGQEQEAAQGPLNRRDFLKLGALAAAGSSLGGLAGCASAGITSPRSGSEVVVIGAGAFGGWTALHLAEMGHRVTLVDAYGAGNSRSTSGDETRGIRTGYANREMWTRLSSDAIRRWKERDERWGTKLFFPTGDLIMRADWDEFTTQTRATWQKLGVRHEVFDGDELRRRYPQINADGINVVLFENDAGVGRSRMATITVADQAAKLGAQVRIGRAEMGSNAGGRLQNVRLSDGSTLGGESFVFALGPWFPKAFPELMASRIRIPMGHVFYYGTPAGDERFTIPNIPSYNFPGVTGWPTPYMDNRGFRVRTGGHLDDDPDTSVRWIDPQYHAIARKVLTDRFPALANAPLIETRACHYEISSSREFIVDRMPGYQNVWIVGGGNAEGFKFGPVVGDVAARLITGQEADAEATRTWKFPEQTFPPATTNRGPL